MLLLVETFVIGSIVGSFLNVIIRRGERKEMILGRSRCESCAKTLSVKELIPIVSFILQKGRCRNCGAALSWQYPLVEAATALLFAGSFHALFPSPELTLESVLPILLLFAGISAGVVILVSDLRSYVIPDGAVIVLFLIGLALLWWRTPADEFSKSILRDFSAAALLSFFLAALWILSRGRWMGLGDAKLIFATSLILGFPVSLAAFFFSFWLGGAVGLMFLFAGRRSVGGKIAFGPYILLGSALAYFGAEKFFILSSLGEFIL